MLLLCVISVVNIGATALVTEATTAIFGEAGVSAATAVMTVGTGPFNDKTALQNYAILHDYIIYGPDSCDCEKS